MDTLRQVIDELTQEVAQIQIQGRALRPEEMARVQAIYQALPHLQQALDILSAEIVTNLVTYKIVSDKEGKLKQSARRACNFWNRFLSPKSAIVIRLGVFTAQSTTIARAYEPYKKDGVIYGVVEFNTKYLDNFKDNEIAGTIVHEIGHTLGFGWDDWKVLFDSTTGEFHADAIKALTALEEMRVETDYGPGTRLAHWDEARFDNELMTGFQDSDEYVLPVTVGVMRLLGHQVVEELTEPTNLGTLLDALSRVAFIRKAEARAIDRDHFESTELWEVVPHSEEFSA